MATFYIKNTFPIRRQLIVFEGEIISGAIRAGQKIKLEPTDSHPEMQLDISSVEYVDHVAEIPSIGLLVKVSNSEDLTDLLDYNIKDETCEIV